MFSKSKPCFSWFYTNCYSVVKTFKAARKGRLFLCPSPG